MQGDVSSLPLAGSAVPHDLSIISLFLQADLIVKVVMFLLLAASFWSWAVIFDKLMKLRRLRRDAEHFEESFWSGGSLDDLYDRIGARPLDPMSAVFAAAMREWRRSAAKGLAASSRPRWAWWRRSPRSSPTTSSPPISAAMPEGSTALPPSSARSSRASSTRRLEPWPAASSMAAATAARATSR
jgi:hypothetical protein